MKLIYISSEEIKHANYHNVGLSYLDQSGLETEVWILDKTCIKGLEKDSRYYRGSNLHYINAVRDLEIRISENNSNTFLLDLATPNICFYLLMKYNCMFYVESFRGLRYPENNRYAISNKERWSVPSAPESLGKRTHRILYRIKKNIYIRTFINHVRDHDYSEIERIENETILKHARGVFTWSDSVLTETMCNSIHLPTPDYSSFIEARDYSTSDLKKEYGIDGDYILFIHSGLGFEMIGLTPYEYSLEIYKQGNFEKYLKKQERLLDRLEDYFKIPVIISEHPGIEYNGYDFGGRYMIAGATHKLVKFCTFSIICYPTVSVSFSVMYNKPILAIGDHLLVDEKCIWNAFYLPLINELNLNFCNMDDESAQMSPWLYITECEETARKHFFDKYISFGIKHESTIGEILEKTIFQDGYNNRNNREIPRV